MRKTHDYIGEVSGPALEDISGINGTPYIKAADGEVTVNCTGFTSWDDLSVIESVKTADGTERVTTLLKLNTIPIPKGMSVGFGFVAVSIKLSAGAGLYHRADGFGV